MANEEDIETTQPSDDILTKTEVSPEQNDEQKSSTESLPAEPINAEQPAEIPAAPPEPVTEAPPETYREILPNPEPAAPVPEPQPVPIPEPTKEPTQQTTSDSPLPPVEIPTPPVASAESAQPSSDLLPKTEGSTEQSEGQKSTTGPPQLSDIKPQISEPAVPPADVVAGLSDDQLKAAAALWAKKNQAEFSKKGVAKRKEIMELNLRSIVDYLSHNNGAPLPRIARHTNITAGTTSKYLRQLIASGKVRAEGWAKDRRYYLK